MFNLSYLYCSLALALTLQSANGYGFWPFGIGERVATPFQGYKGYGFYTGDLSALPSTSTGVLTEYGSNYGPESYAEPNEETEQPNTGRDSGHYQYQESQVGAHKPKPSFLRVRNPPRPIAPVPGTSARYYGFVNSMPVLQAPVLTAPGFVSPLSSSQSSGSSGDSGSQPSFKSSFPWNWIFVGTESGQSQNQPQVQQHHQQYVEPPSYYPGSTSQTQYGTYSKQSLNSPNQKQIHHQQQQQPRRPHLPVLPSFQGPTGRQPVQQQLANQESQLQSQQPSQSLNGKPQHQFQGKSQSESEYVPQSQQSQSGQFQTTQQQQQPQQVQRLNQNVPIRVPAVSESSQFTQSQPQYFSSFENFQPQFTSNRQFPSYSGVNQHQVVQRPPQQNGQSFPLTNLYQNQHPSQPDFQHLNSRSVQPSGNKPLQNSFSSDSSLEEGFGSAPVPSFVGPLTKRTDNVQPTMTQTEQSHLLVVPDSNKPVQTKTNSGEHSSLSTHQVEQSVPEQVTSVVTKVISDVTNNNNSKFYQSGGNPPSTVDGSSLVN